MTCRQSIVVTVAPVVDVCAVPTMAAYPASHWQVGLPFIGTHAPCGPQSNPSQALDATAVPVPVSSRLTATDSQ